MPKAFLNYYQKKLLLQSHFVRRFLSKFTFFQFLTISLLVSILVAYPGQNYFQTLQLSPSGEVKKAEISLPPIELPQYVGQNYPSLGAKAAFVLDLNSSTVLFEKNSNLRLHPASTTKIMTALVTLDSFNLSDTLAVKSANQAIGNKIKLSSNDQLTVKDLLYGLLVSSANDAAVTLAQNYPGSGYAGFISAMNQKASQLHLQNTTFSNVSGIESSDHKTTVRDLALLTKEALKSDLIREIVSSTTATISAQNTGNKYLLSSTNQLLGKVPGVKGFKTGWTENAGECLITFVERDNHPLLIVVLDSRDRFGESKFLINWAYTSHLWGSI